MEVNKQNDRIKFTQIYQENSFSNQLEIPIKRLQHAFYQTHIVNRVSVALSMRIILTNWVVSILLHFSMKLAQKSIFRIWEKK